MDYDFISNIDVVVTIVLLFVSQEWFSRQQLVMLVLFVNVSLAIMFFKLLT